jgi:hypothetical protein
MIKLTRLAALREDGKVPINGQGSLGNFTIVVKQFYISAYFLSEELGVDMV